MQRRHLSIARICLAVWLVSSAAQSSAPPQRPPFPDRTVPTQTSRYFQFPPSGSDGLLGHIDGPGVHCDTQQASAIQTVWVDSLFPPVRYASFEDRSPDVIDEEHGNELAAENLTVSSELPDATARSLEGDFSDSERVGDLGLDLYAPSDFTKGLVVYGKDVALKIGGYIKGDLIYDFNPIASTDTFDTTTIPVGAPQRTNTRFHARQSRLSFDTRWGTAWGPTRAFVETDFFGDGNTSRLRQAYGEIRHLIVGQTWTTLAHRAAIPQTLDSEGAVSSISRRQAQVRWTQEILIDGLDMSLALEDPHVIIESPQTLPGSAREPTPDFIARVRLTRDWGQVQCAAVFRELGFQPVAGPVATKNAWGVSLTGALEVTEWNNFYYQVLFGTGIGSYKGLPDIVLLPPNDYEILDVFGWMVGWKHEWNERWTSNFTYSINRFNNASFQVPDGLHEDTYLAANLIWNPVERFYLGAEYLFGTRENVDGAKADANRIQASFVFVLP